MTKNNIEYYQIAAVQIDRAIQLYFEQDFICAITLAGAGEEILGKLLRAQGNKSILDELVLELENEEDVKKALGLEGSRVVDHLNSSRNSLKHLKVEAFGIEIEIKQEAELMLHRAIINYSKLMNAPTACMQNFAEQYSTKTN